MSPWKCLSHTLLAVILLVFCVGCDDDGTGPRPDAFSLEVTVQTVDGEPLEGMSVVVWNMSSSLEAFLQDGPFLRRRARTTVRFELPRRAECEFVVSDAAGRSVRAVLQGDTLAVGAHELSLGADLTFDAGVEVFRYELVAREPATGEELFRDTKWMTAVHLDRSRLKVPTTGPDGRWSTTDPTIAPGLLDLPEMPAVDFDGSEIGSFVLGDTLVVRVYDPGGGYLQETVTVGNAANVVEFTWDLAILRQGQDAPPGRTDQEGVPARRTEGPGPVATFSLRQNAPNPFN